MDPSNSGTATTADRWLSDPDLRRWIEERTGGRPTAVKRIQSLWSGYGEVVRLDLQGGAMGSVVVKWVELPERVHHPRGWTGDAGHLRKLRSYEVERYFYAEISPTPAPACRTATCHAAEATEHGWRFVLEDLDASGFRGRPTSLGSSEVELCLAWLAAFHGRHVGRDVAGLWPTGTYWHLATRRDELAALRDPELVAAARPLSEALEGCRYQTLVHGDAKVANFCFGADEVAAVDFQYVGGGCGMKDVAYFLSSCLRDSECEAEAPGLLELYFDHLRGHLPAAVDAEALVAEWRSLYPAAWADFHRFLAGWAPGHWKIHRYTREMTRQALRSL